MKNKISVFSQASFLIVTLLGQAALAGDTVNINGVVLNVDVLVNRKISVLKQVLIAGQPSGLKFAPKLAIKSAQQVQAKLQVFADQNIKNEPNAKGLSTLPLSEAERRKAELLIDPGFKEFNEEFSDFFEKGDSQLWEALSPSDAKKLVDAEISALVKLVPTNPTPTPPGLEAAAPAPAPSSFPGGTIEESNGSQSSSAAADNN